MGSILNNFLNAYTLVSFITGVIAWTIGKFIFSRWFFKKEYRMFSNLRRTILIIGSTKETLEVEKKIIDKSGFFRYEYVIEDNPEKASALIDKHILVVWGYTKTKKINRFIDILRARNIPLLVYSTKEIDKEDKTMICEYSFSEIANSPLRLMNLIFNIVALLPYDKK